MSIAIAEQLEKLDGTRSGSLAFSSRCKHPSSRDLRGSNRAGAYGCSGQHVDGN